jgi:AraC-like DNA-binding protein
VSEPPLQPRIHDGRALLIHTHHHEPGHEKTLHGHPEGQIWAVRQGLVTAQMGDGSWVLPAGRIGWIPPGTLHAARVHETASGWMAYLRADLCQQFPAQPTVFEMTALSIALLDRLSGWDTASGSLSLQQTRLLDVLLDELKASPALPMFLPMPRNPRLAAMALDILANPADKRTLDEWALHVGLSKRGLTRHFRQETGMSLVQWRIVARMKRALELLSHGDSVTSIALELGYDSISSFIAAFSHQFGVTPGAYAG